MGIIAFTKEHITDRRYRPLPTASYGARTEKAVQREAIDNQVAEFLAQGKHIENLPSNATGVSVKFNGGKGYKPDPG